MIPPVQTRYSSVFNVNSAALKDSLDFSHPLKVLAAGVICRGSDNGGATVKFTKCLPQDSSITANGNVATINIPAANNQGKTIYLDLNDSSIELLGGWEIQIEVTAENVSALNVTAFVDFVRSDETLSNVAAAEESV